MDPGGEVYLALDHGVKRGFGTVSDDLGMHPAAAFEYAEDRDFASRSAAAFAADAACAEEAFIDLCLAGEVAAEGGKLGHAATEDVEEAQCGLAVEAGDFGGLGDSEIGAEKAQYLAECGLKYAHAGK